MQRVASKKDFLQYCSTFMSIYKKVLKEGVGYDALAIVSTRQGSLIFFTFKRGTERLRFKKTPKSIGTELERLPQRAFAGDLSNVVFGGKNVIREGNKLIIIKGDNSPSAWSRMEAIRDSWEEIDSLAGRY
jgi:hypothetical protein